MKLNLLQYHIQKAGLEFGVVVASPPPLKGPLDTLMVGFPLGQDPVRIGVKAGKSLKSTLKKRKETRLRSLALHMSHYQLTRMSRMQKMNSMSIWRTTIFALQTKFEMNNIASLVIGLRYPPGSMNLLRQAPGIYALDLQAMITRHLWTNWPECENNFRRVVNKNNKAGLLDRLYKNQPL